MNLGTVLQTQDEQALTDFQFACVNKDNVRKCVERHSVLLSRCTPKFVEGEQRYYETQNVYYVASARDSKLRKFVRPSGGFFYGMGVVK